MSTSRAQKQPPLGLEIDKIYPSGEFYWDVRRLPEQAVTESSKAPQSKFELLAWLGLMPDTNILSNKLIKVVGEHVFELLWRKANYKSYFSFFSHLQKRRENVPELYDSIEQQELWYCWRLIAKLRAMQEIDYLFNRKALSDEDINDRLKKTKDALEELYPLTDFSQGSQEQLEWQALQHSLTELSATLKLANTTADRNELLQQWQHKTFRHLLANFQISQGELSAVEHDIVPRENWENTTVTREAETILQNWEFGETSIIKDTMLYRNDTGDVFYSGTYSGSDDINKQHLLFAAQLSELYGPSLGLDANKCASTNNLNNKNDKNKYLLHQTRDSYDQMKTDINNETIAIKMRLKNAKKDPTNPELQTSSNLLSEWWAQWKTSSEHATELHNALDALVTTEVKPSPPKVSPQASPNKPAIDAKPEAIKVPSTMAEGVTSGSYSLTAPAEKNYVFSPGDSISAALRFFYEFTLYFDQMMDKHPFVATTAFAVPYIQFGGIGLAIGGNNALMGLANLLAGFESKLFGGKVTAAQINEIVKIIDEGILWLTSAESPLQILITCGFTFSKVSYTIVDTIVNDILSRADETTLSELAKKFDPTGTLEGYTTAEAAKSYLTSTINGLSLLVVATIVGVGGDLSQSAILEFFAHVPLSLLTNPSIQTLGAVKASGLLIGKLAGINNYISREELIDINGRRITTKSNSYHVLKLFVELSIPIKQLQPGEVNSPHFRKIRNHFEELLQMNPQLIHFFDKKQLKELGVTIRYSAWYHRLPLAFLKSVFYAVMFAPAILAHCYYAATDKPIPPMWKLSLAVPINWVILTGKITWTAFKALFHGFLQIAIRIPEVAVQSIFVIFRLTFGTIGNSLSIGFGYIAKGCGYLLNRPWCPDPHRSAVALFFSEHIGNKIRSAQIIVVTWVRVNIRYRLEQLLGAMLKLARDYLVRKGEQWLQRALAPDPSQPEPSPTDKLQFPSTPEKQKSATALVEEFLAKHQKNNNKPETNAAKKEEDLKTTIATSPHIFVKNVHELQDPTVITPQQPTIESSTILVP